MTMTILLLMAALAGQAAPPAAPAPVPTEAEAIALATIGEYQRAVDAFSKIVAATPANYEARVWLARLHGWMGQTAQAEEEYRRVLRESPEQLDAMVGLGNTLVNTGRAADALDVLGAAERRTPDNADVLSALARANQRLARFSRAQEYADRAVAVAPTPDNRLIREQIRSARGHRVESHSFVEQFADSGTEARNTDLTVNLRLHDRLRIFGRGQAQDKFSAKEERAGGGVEWRVSPQATLTVSALGGRDTTVLPGIDANAEVSYARGRVQPIAGAQYVEFSTAKVLVASPGVAFWPADWFSLTTRYYFTRTEYTGDVPQEDNHSGFARVSYRPWQRLWVSGGYSKGIDSFDALSPDRIGKFRADTGSAGLRLDLPSLTSVAATYERQWRSRSVSMERFTLSLVQRF